MMKLNGIHHITAVTGDAQSNLDFYVGVMGLRFVKKGVNQDDPLVYHLFYGDEHAQPGADLTFFEYPNATPGTPGAGMLHRILWQVGSRDALAFWDERLQAAGITPERINDDTLRFRDPEGLEQDLVVGLTDNEPLTAQADDIPPEHALQGFAGARAFVADPEASDDVLTELLGFERSGDQAGEYVLAGPDRSAHYGMDASSTRAQLGAGSIHHIAWWSADDEQEAWVSTLTQAGLGPSPVIDRHYFESVYFLEPGSVLFELATAQPGFDVDEPIQTLGDKLSLPPRLEPLREQIEAAVRPIHNPRPRTVRS